MSERSRQEGRLTFKLTLRSALIKVDVEVVVVDGREEEKRWEKPLFYRGSGAVVKAVTYSKGESL